jgi:hypothetical protein
MRNVKATRTSVLAWFINPPSETVSKGGIIIINDDGDSRGIKTRFFRIHDVGVDSGIYHDIKPGDIVAVAHGRWTRGFDVDHPDGNKLYGLDPKDILGTYDGKVDDLI